MKQIKLNNVIFPVWFLLFFPPVIFITFIGNFIIDSIVLIVCFYIFKVAKIQIELKEFYKKSILRVWVFGFIADIIGAIFLLTITSLDIPYEVMSAINFNPFKNPAAVIIILIAMLISSALIFLFNYKITFKKFIENKKLRLKIAITIAIVTIPWTFLLPTKWFYRGF